MQFGFALLVVAAVFLVLCDGLSASTDVDAVRSKTAFSGRLSSEENVSSTDKRNRFLRTSKFGDGDSDDRYDTTVDEERMFKLPTLTRSKSLSNQVLSHAEEMNVLKGINQEAKKLAKTKAEELYRVGNNPDQVFKHFDLDPKVVEQMKAPKANKYKIWEEATEGDTGVKLGAYRLWDMLTKIYKQKKPNWVSELN